MRAGGPPRRPPSVVLTLLKVAAILLAVVVIARLVPMAIRAIGAAGRGGAQAMAGATRGWPWIVAGVVLVVALALLVRRLSGRRRPGSPGQRRPPPRPN